MAHHLYAVVICLEFLCGALVFAIRDLRSTFDNLKAQKGLVYSPEEEAQHLARFEEELKAQAKFISTEDVAELFDETRPAIMQSFVDEINSKQKAWTASIEQGRLKTFSLGDTKRLCGTLREAASGLTKKVYAPEELQDLPADFDARSGFPKCSGVIGHIRDQSACGSCWAFGTTEAFNDRLCIKSDGNFTELLSAGEMNACAIDRHFMKETSPHHYSSLDDAKKAIQTDGPVSAAFGVYEDFLAYKSGVYKHTSGTFLGGHAVKIIGWGEEKGEGYWLVANSWNGDWGDHGFFKIAFGQCGINDLLLGGTPKV
ncbi:hypothetical protein FOZ61_009834 [Perkinsus olseni]|uniref:Peptidase C1A papain C-terminal domain-containing protein n=1 Tax=Perkinsus olseni TaxID=32597 RepID=A0A7J6KX71_PEROL|nr:hypothetical protein FOL46_010040 [Perkinsus olseni]KAF4652210.1 hypothetical protein FOZ61_009834 [Perkinsus olseni]